MKACPSCEAHLPEKARFCGNCGAAIQLPPPAGPEGRGFGFYVSTLMALAGMAVFGYGLFTGQLLYTVTGPPLVAFGMFGMKESDDK